LAIDEGELSVPCPAVHIEYKAKFCPVQYVVYPKKNVSETWSPSKHRGICGDAHTKLSHIETCFESLVLQGTAAPTDRIQQVTLYMQKCFIFET